MKKNPQESRNTGQARAQKNPSPFMLALVVTGILVIEFYPTLIQRAIAKADVIQSEHTGIRLNSLGKEWGGVLVSINESEVLPPSIAMKVRQYVAQQTGNKLENINITSFSRQQWPNACLGLPQTNEVCAQVIVEGWRVVLSNGSQSWVYRSNQKGTFLREEPLKN
jgi:hypothetical protein